MGLKTFNIEDDIYEEFTKKHKGDMSSIISKLITNYLNIKKENLEISKVKERLEKIRSEIETLKTDESNLVLFIADLETEHRKDMQKSKDEHLEIRKWARDVIRDAKTSGNYADIVYESETNGFSDVEEYLVQKWLKNEIRK